MGPVLTELGSAESRTIGASESAESRYMFPNTNNNQLQQLQFQNRMALLKQRQQRLRNQVVMKSGSKTRVRFGSSLG